MTLLDRFLTQPRDRHPDPAVRLAFVQELPLDDHSTIALLARDDEDPRVRRAAVAKLMAPAVLASILREDRDENVRAQASAMLRDIALEAFEDTGEAESLEAVEAIADMRLLAQIAKTSGREAVAVRALARIDDAHLLGSVARHALVEGVRLSAMASLRGLNDHEELLAVAMNSDFKDTAVAALDAITARADLEQVVARGRNKSAVKRARTVLREADEATAREQEAEAAAALSAAALSASPAVADPAETSATPPHGDPLMPVHIAPHQELEAAMPRESEEEARLREAQEAEQAADRARAQAEAEAEARAAAERELAERHVRLAELVEQAVATATDTDVPSARRRFGQISREWRTLSAGIEVDPALLARFTAIDEEIAARDREAREIDARSRHDALARINQLLHRVEPLVGKADLSLKSADQALRSVRTALSAMPPLPTKADYDETVRRLKEAQAALLPKVRELRDADDWKRFANAGIQEQLCAQMEALRAVEDPEQIALTVRDLQQKWRDAAEVPRAQADALWRRFKTAHDEVWPRCEAYFAEQARERSENLAKKIAICEKAESLAESTNWLQTAEEIKKLQAEWKTIGAVSRGKEKAIWDRFRSACDRFFTRRHEDLAARKVAWAENLARKEALSVRAEELAESTDWDSAAAEIKRLQTEWKTIGPVKKSKSEAIWNRFRAACDRFFTRYAQRHDLAREARAGAREALCSELESLLAAEEPATDLASTVRALQSRWQSSGVPRGPEQQQARALDQRFAAALSAILSRWPVAFAGTDLDTEANRKRMDALVQRMEALASSLAGSGQADSSLSPTTRLATMLKEALAANTIGGKVNDDSRLRGAIEDARHAQASWSRIGLVPEDVRRQLSDRFQRAVRSIMERAGKLEEARRSAGSRAS